MAEENLYPLPGFRFIQELAKVGLADGATRRVTIDAPIDEVVTIYLEKVGDKRLIDMIPALKAGAVINTRPDPQIVDGPDISTYNVSETPAGGQSQFIPETLNRVVRGDDRG